MPASPVAVAVTLIAPALDTTPDPASPVPPGSFDGDFDPAVDRLGELCGGRFERHPIEPRPWETRLMARLGLAGPGLEAASGPGDVPAGRLLGATDLALSGGAVASSDTVLADPVSLAPNRDEATLTPPEALALGADETEALFGAANELLAEDAEAFERGASGRWYLRGLDARALDTPPTHFLARREAGGWLPGTGDAAPWRRLMSELEMLWHAHPVNAERARRGLPPVNGVWFWGGASPPPVPSPLPRAVLLADDRLAVALGEYAGTEVRALDDSDTFDAALSAARKRWSDATDEVAGGKSDGATVTLVIVDQRAHAAWLAGDGDALERARRELAERWLVPAAAAVRDGRALSLSLVSDDGRETLFVPPARPSWLARLFGRRP